MNLGGLTMSVVKCRVVGRYLLLALAALLFSGKTFAEDGWQFTLPVYAWLPTYEFELLAGSSSRDIRARASFRLK